MDDIIGRVTGIFLAVIILFGMPFVYMQERAKTAEQMYLLSVDTEFVDSVCSIGFISMEMYRGFLNQLAALPGVYEVYLIHEQKELLCEGESCSYVSTFYDEEDILTVLKEGERYCFGRGDYLKAVIVKTAGTIRVPWVKDTTVNIFYGGTVRDEII